MQEISMRASLRAEPHNHKDPATALSSPAPLSLVPRPGSAGGTAWHNPSAHLAVSSAAAAEPTARSQAVAVQGEPSLRLGPLLARALDEVDLGIALLGPEAEVLHLNHRARQLLSGEGPLELLGTRLRVPDTRSLARLHDALRDATQRGLRRLLTLGQGDSRQVAALVPVQPGVAALVLGRVSVCEELSLQCFAREHALTSAETRVLAALGRGVAPAGIAREQGVKLSTVRTQIGAIRQKTGTASIVALVRLVAGLPPMVGALRG